jgi:hypothetical protein
VKILDSIVVFSTMRLIAQCLGVAVAFWIGNHPLLCVVDVIDKQQKETVMKLSRILPFVVGSAAAGILVSSVSPAQALVFNVGGTDYDVTTATGTYNSLITQLQSEPWWGNSALAVQFASTVNNQLGLPNGGQGPFFAFGTGLFINSQVWSGSGVSQIGIDSTTTITWATTTPATPVPFDIPGGATIPTVGSLLALALMRKAKKSMASKTRIANPVSTTIS